MHNINLEADYKPMRQPQRRLNPIMKEEVRKEVLKLLEAGRLVGGFREGLVLHL